MAKKAKRDKRPREVVPTADAPTLDTPTVSADAVEDNTDIIILPATPIADSISNELDSGEESPLVEDAQLYLALTAGCNVNSGSHISALITHHATGEPDITVWDQLVKQVSGVSAIELCQPHILEDRELEWRSTTKTLLGVAD